MASNVQIANIALSKIGESPIMALDEDNNTARAVNLLFQPTRDALLREHRWNFAMARAACPQLTETPAFGYSYKYQLPSDCLRVIQLENMDTPYEVEGDTVLTDASSCNIIYIKQVDDPNKFDPLFLEAFTARLAMELAFILSDSISLVDAMRTLYKEKMSLARSIDAQENGPREIVADVWLDSMA